MSVKKTIKYVLVFALCTTVFLIGRYVFYMLPVFTAGAAKISCSCIYVGERTLESIQRDELANFPLNLNKIEVDEQHQSVTASIFGLGKRKAIYRKGLGCTLVAEKSEDEIRTQKIVSPPELTYDPDTIRWPMGNIIDSAIFYSTQYVAIKQAVSNAFHEKNRTKPLNTRAIIVLHRGQIIAEQYADGYNSHQPQLGWSMTKSFSNALIGILIKNEKLGLADKGVYPKWRDSDDPRYQITLDNLLTMTSGLEWNESYFSWSPAVEMVYDKADMSNFAASFPSEHHPGKWKYSSGTTNILFGIIKNATGADYYSFPYRELFHKIGMAQTIIELDAAGGFVGSTFGWATPRDWARFGLLYLNGGMWQGEQILPKDWIRYSSNPSPQAPRKIYAAQFWHTASDSPPEIPADLYFAQGYEGQRVMIIPSKDIVIVRLGQTYFNNFEWNDFLSSILQSLDQ